MQTQLTYHYGWKYNRNVTIRQATPTSSDLAVYIDNNEANFPGDCNANRCYGVHYTSTDVAPLGTIYINAGAVITLTNGQPFNVPLTISIGHEVMEAVEDPGINRVAIAGSTACIFELVDPVETVNANNSWFYYISAYDPVSQGYVYVPVADFVFPNFFVLSGPGAPFDLTGTLQSAFQTSDNYQCGTIIGSIPGLNRGLGRTGVSRAHKAPTFSLPTSLEEFVVNGVRCRKGTN